MEKIIKSLLFAIPIMLGCNHSESPLPVVNTLEAKRYMGTWYEIARLPNSFEEGLTNITATYTLRDDGKITVLNKGIKTDGTTSQAEGIAYIPNINETAKLKVSFFRPFYGKYWVIDLDTSYQYAVVGHPNRKYLWILGRTPRMSQTIYDSLIKKTAALGFDTTALVIVNHNM
jgi:apolipoprotein D and lipocalin family protein